MTAVLLELTPQETVLPAAVRTLVPKRNIMAMGMHSIVTVAMRIQGPIVRSSIGHPFLQS